MSIFIQHEVLTFHVPIFNGFLVDKRVVGVVASIDWLSPQNVILSSNEEPSSPRKVVVGDLVVNVSVTGGFFLVGVVSPRSTPILEDQGFSVGVILPLYHVGLRHQSATPIRHLGDAPLRRVIPARGPLRLI